MSKVLPDCLWPLLSEINLGKNLSGRDIDAAFTFFTIHLKNLKIHLQVRLLWRSFRHKRTYLNTCFCDLKFTNIKYYGVHRVRENLILWGPRCNTIIPMLRDRFVLRKSQTGLNEEFHVALIYLESNGRKFYFYNVHCDFCILCWNIY